MRTIDEYRRENPLAVREASAARLRPMAQEAVRMDALTGDQHWDHFLSFIEAATKNATAARDAWLFKLRDPLMVNPDELATCRAQVARLDSQIQVLETVIQLPKVLKTQAEKAGELLAALRLDKPE